MKTLTRFQLDVLRYANEAIEFRRALFVPRTSDTESDELMVLERLMWVSVAANDHGWAVIPYGMGHRVDGWVREEKP